MPEAAIWEKQQASKGSDQNNPPGGPVRLLSKDDELEELVLSIEDLQKSVPSYNYFTKERTEKHGLQYREAMRQYQKRRHPATLVPRGGASVPIYDAEVTERVLQWLEKEGVSGVEQLEPRQGGGVMLRMSADVHARNAVILRIPKRCWISASAHGPDPATDLSWCLLQEFWRGAASPFAPLVDSLRF